MITSPLTSSARSSAQRVWEPAREGLRQRRQARAQRRQLERELASYTTSAEVDDLLASLSGQDEASVAEIRALVVGNLQDSHRLVGIAS